jgi:nitroimidazol reductase NimA-like FMN-containing flavoprotein (pyridoxamine 5'-phosphate oxidase superfamily)
MCIYHIRRKDKEINDPKLIEELLFEGKAATVALSKNNEPYLVTLNYGYDAKENALYFHSAARGMKNDFIAANKKACATVIIDRGYIYGKCDHSFKSAVMFGNIEIVEDFDEKKRALDIMTAHLETDKSAKNEIEEITDAAIGKVFIWKLIIDRISGKHGPV